MGISRMAEAQIPTDKGMLITGHRDVKSYNQYNTNPLKLQMEICQRIISGDGKKYVEVLSQEVKKANAMKVRLHFALWFWYFVFIENVVKSADVLAKFCLILLFVEVLQ